MEERLQIKAMDSWNQFFKSGKVEDYLQYVSQHSSSLKQDTGMSNWGGENSHAGFDTGNRYDIETDAYR